MEKLKPMGYGSSIVVFVGTSREADFRQAATLHSEKRR
jgi:hypothetical protein